MPAASAEQPTPPTPPITPTADQTPPSPPPTPAPKRRHWLRRPVAWIVGAPPALLLLSLLSVNAYIHATTSNRLFDTLPALSAALTASPPKTPPVAIVLGAHVYEDGRPSDALTDRLATALDLYNTQLVRHILVTGDNSPASDHETDIMRAWLIERGVPPDAIWTDPSGVRTLDSMARAAEVFQIQDAIICTQRFHLPRSLFLAAAYDIRALGLVSDRHTYVKALQFWTREQLARALSVLDVHILHTRPAHDLSTEGVISPRHIPAPTE